MNKETNIKHAKLHGKHRSSSYRSSVGRNLPWLNLSGLWLEQAGFPIGQPIEISVENRKLTINAL